VIGANSVSVSVGDFNSSLPIPDPLAVLRDSSSTELKAIYNQFRPILDNEQQPEPSVKEEQVVIGDRQEYGGYASSAFQSVPISYLRREVNTKRQYLHALNNQRLIRSMPMIFFSHFSCD
jgi:hypothetical protein